MKRFLTIALLIIFLFPFEKLKAESGLLITPAVNNLNLKPGETYTGSFKLINNNEFKVTLEVTKGLINDDDSISIDNFTNSSIDWIKLDTSSVEINSLKDRNFNYSITVPADTQEGYFRPMFVFKLIASQDESGAITSLTQLLPFQFNIFVSESGVYNGNLVIKSVAPGKKILVGNDQTINFNVVNSSNSPAKPLIRIQIVAPNGDIVFQSVQNESLSTLTKDKALTGIVDASSGFNENSSMGRYSIEVLAKDTLTGKSVTERVYFWFVPQNIILIAALILVLLILLSIFIWKLKRSSKKRRHQDKHLFMYK